MEYSGNYPHFIVLANEVRSAAAWPGMTKKHDWIATTGLAQAVFPGVFGAKLARGGRGVD